MKKAFALALLSAVIMSYPANAQGVKFGKRYMKQRMEQRKQEAAKKAAANAAKETQALKANANSNLDEYEEKDGDRIYRYVYTYDKDKMRSSETIYLTEKTDGKWGTERLYTVGHYTYEYDTQDRLAVKTVTYDDNDYFDTYRVMVNYGDGVTEYKKYVWDKYDKAYRMCERWSYYDNGILASYTSENNGYYHTASTFDMNGVNTSYTYNGSKVTFGGELNNGIVTYYDGEGWDENSLSYASWKQNKKETYKYDPANGKLAEYTLYDNYYDDYYEARKYTYTYDALGRITAIREYGKAGDDDEDSGGATIHPGDVNGDGVIDENDRPAYPVTRASETDEIEWELTDEEMYTYFNDDVYGVGNSWHDVFGMDGPLARIDVTDYDGKAATLFERDADGKLTNIVFPNQVTDSYYTSTDKATIDDNGQILKIEEEFSYVSGSWEDDPNYNGESYSDYSYMSTDYTWTDGQAVKAVMYDKSEHTSPSDNWSREYTETKRYTYDDNKVAVSVYPENSSTPSERTFIEDDGVNRKVYHKSSYEDEYIKSYLQTEDISFVRPNIKADVEGMTADSTIVVSIAGRVVCAYDKQYSSSTVCNEYITFDYDNNAYYINTTSGSTYFTIEHDGNETTCSDIKGLPIYILTDGRLTKEYSYYESLLDNGGGSEPATRTMATRAAAIPEGQAYSEITYLYDTDGRLAGKTEVSVDENGTRTEEIKLEYKYDEASGIASVEADAKVGVNLDGRRIGLSDNSAFSVCTISGQVVAAGVTSYTFHTPGIYIINAGGITAKVSVK